MTHEHHEHIAEEAGHAAVERALATRSLTLSGLQADLDVAILHATDVLTNVLATATILGGVKHDLPALATTPLPIGQLGSIEQQIAGLRDRLAHIDDANAHVCQLLGG
jgi:hypothetical protein